MTRTDGVFETNRKSRRTLAGLYVDRCYDNEFVIAPPIAYDHGCVPIGRRDQ